jgi:hypothetical protein
LLSHYFFTLQVELKLKKEKEVAELEAKNKKDADEKKAKEEQDLAEEKRKKEVCNVFLSYYFFNIYNFFLRGIISRVNNVTFF